MNIKPVSGPGQVPPNGTPEHVRTSKAIQAFQKGVSSYDAPTSQPQPHAQSPAQVVQNQSRITPEEMGAIQTSPEPQGITADTPIPTPDVDLTSKPEETQESPDSASHRFAQLARQERQLRARAQQQDTQLKAKEAELKAKEDALRAKEAEMEREWIRKADLKQNAYQKLIENDVSIDDLTQSILNAPDTDPRISHHISKLEAKIAELEGKYSKTEEKFTQQEKQQRAAAIQQINTDVTNLVKQSDEYETIRHTNSEKDVTDLIVKTYDEDGYIMTVEEAAEEVEKYLREEAWKLARLGSVQKYGQSVAPKPKPVQTQQTQPKAPTTPPPMRTLTNNTSSSRPLTARERAVLKFKGEL